MKLTDLIGTTAPAKGVGADGKELPINAKHFKGPYLETKGGIDNSGIPHNLFVYDDDTGRLDKDLSAHWSYRNGVIHPAVPTSGMTLDHIPYQSL